MLHLLINKNVLNLISYTSRIRIKISCSVLSSNVKYNQVNTKLLILKFNDSTSNLHKKLRMTVCASSAFFSLLNLEGNVEPFFL